MKRILRQPRSVPSTIQPKVEPWSSRSSTFTAEPAGSRPSRPSGCQSGGADAACLLSAKVHSLQEQVTHQAGQLSRQAGQINDLQQQLNSILPVIQGIHQALKLPSPPVLPLQRYVDRIDRSRDSRKQPSKRARRADCAKHATGTNSRARHWHVSSRRSAARVTTLCPLTSQNSGASCFRIPESRGAARASCTLRRMQPARANTIAILYAPDSSL